ncbi:hormone-sensitive lipase isoform X2 [Pristis pectinata]|uniref:hormone-sensitive lipase isoform X2 n=1 Tax=Pristis pectinata TaxID=685728 RepID=UPI00223D89B5|nr:hormone-sensitive lipase isoform X2 [Pristis pectinata]
MASGGAAPGSEGRGASVREPAGSIKHASSMDTRTMFLVLLSVTEDNVRFFQENLSETSRRFIAAFTQIQEHGRGLQPLMLSFSAVCADFDFDERTPANGYRSLMKVVRSCVLHIIHKARYISANRHSIFFRTSHNLMEIEAYSSALRQLRALLYIAQKLLTTNKLGDLFFSEERGLSEEFLHESNSMHKGCFYGRCLGFQFSPSIRPFLQTISIGLVSFGENYRRHETSFGIAATSIFTSGKYAIDPELRGSEFERLTQNLDVHFWKAFWNITEMEILASLVTLTSTTVRVNKTLSVPPNPFELPLLVDPNLMVQITPPVAHSGPGPVQMRLISYELRDGQESDELNSLCKPEAQLSLDMRLKSKKAPRSRFLVVHFHGGGFVAQTSKSHEPYLKSWSHELDSPILSVDYSLAPEAPFPRALEECFFAYCWAVKNCHLLGSTGERICLAGDSAGGNLCITVCMQAASYGVRLPDGIMVAYPATLLQATASPSRLLTFIDPLLPLSVLSRCLGAYAGLEPADGSPSSSSSLEKADPLSVARNDTAPILRDIRLGASAWISSLLDSGKGGGKPVGLRWWACLRRPLNLLVHLLRPRSPVVSNCLPSDGLRKSCSEAALSRPCSSHSSLDSQRDYVMSRTCEEAEEETVLAPGQGEQLPARGGGGRDGARLGFELGLEEKEEEPRPRASKFPEGFQPLRSGSGNIKMHTSAIVKNPFMSPLLAPDHMLKGLPAVHLVACALDPMLDDAVMFAKRLRGLGQPVTLCVVEDLPHGFLSLSQLSRETKEASKICVAKIREVLQSKTVRAHRKLERLGAKPQVPQPVDRETGA